MKIHNIHDSGFKALYLIKEVAQAHIEKLIDKDIADQINLEDFMLEPTAYLDENLQNSFSDIVYSATFKDKKGAKKDLKIIFLFEHKSYYSGNPHIQVGGYIFRILEQVQTQEGNYPIVIPIIVYHGNTKWKYRKLSEYFNDLPEFAKRFLPDFEIIVTDLANYSDEILLKLLKDKLLLNALLTLKHGRKETYVIKYFDRLTIGLGDKMENELVRNFFHIIFFYLNSVSNVSVSKLVALFHGIMNNDTKIIDMLLKELETKSPVELLGREADLLRTRQRFEIAKQRLKEAEQLQKELEQRRKEEIRLRKESEQRRKEEIRLRKESEQRRKEEIRLRREAEQRRKEEVRLRKEAEQKLEENTKATILILAQEYQYNADVIASITRKSVEYVKEVLAKA